jgi:putative ABC transport system substrate-binding protein
MKKSAVPSFLVAVILLAGAVLAEAQQPKKVFRIGYLSGTDRATDSPRAEGIRRALRELGYVEGKNIVIEFRYAEGKPDRLAELAAELVRVKADAIIAGSNIVARAALAATKTIPIVMASGADPVATGLVASLARPGGNVTGLTSFPTDLGVKRLELLKEIFPKLARVAILPSPSRTARELKEMQTAAPYLQIQLEILEVRVADDLEKAFESATKARAGALAVTSDGTGLFVANAKQITELAVKNRLPAIYPSNRYVNVGGLMSYAADEIEGYRRAAVYVDKILKGAKPAELPVEQSTKFEFVINLKAAKQIGLTIPPDVLARANKVIK